MRYGMVIDLRRCVGCNACTMACKVSRGTPPGMFYSHVQIEEQGEYPNAQAKYLPVLCQHCDNPACVNVCPTGASFKDENGIVLIDQAKCIGCRYCIAACPYDVRTFLAASPEGYYPEKGLTEQEKLMYDGFSSGRVYKCDFCKSKDSADSDPEPACARTCPGGARIFGDLDDPDSEVSKLVSSNQTYCIGAEFGTDPNIYYIAR